MIESAKERGEKKRERERRKEGEGERERERERERENNHVYEFNTFCDILFILRPPKKGLYLGQRSERS